MGSQSEQVAIYDANGDRTGTSTRARMRTRGLWHAAASVLVLSPDRQSVYLHRRTECKDIYPGMHDCWAGGVVAARETPDETASRELAEELGIHDVQLEPVLRTVHELGNVRFHAFLYEVCWAGPIVHQQEEVAEGWWIPVERLRERLRDPHWPFVPDGRQFFEQWIAIQPAIGPR